MVAPCSFGTSACSDVDTMSLTVVGLCSSGYLCCFDLVLTIFSNIMSQTKYHIYLMGGEYFLKYHVKNKQNIMLIMI